MTILKHINNNKTQKHVANLASLYLTDVNYNVFNVRYNGAVWNKKWQT